MVKMWLLVGDNPIGIAQDCLVALTIRNPGSGKDDAPPLELAKQADEPLPLGRLVGDWQCRDQQLVDFGRQ